jgi:hypothetical protein
MRDLALSPLGERVSRFGAFTGRSGTGEGVVPRAREYSIHDHPQAARKGQWLITTKQTALIAHLPT